MVSGEGTTTAAEEDNSDEIKEETTRAAEDERPEPGGMVPSMRSFMPFKVLGVSWAVRYWRWPR